MYCSNAHLYTGTVDVVVNCLFINDVQLMFCLISGWNFTVLYWKHLMCRHFVFNTCFILSYHSCLCNINIFLLFEWWRGSGVAGAVRQVQRNLRSVGSSLSHPNPPYGLHVPAIIRGISWGEGGLPVPTLFERPSVVLPATRPLWRGTLRRQPARQWPAEK